jgi:hypothetical protein
MSEFAKSINYFASGRAEGAIAPGVRRGILIIPSVGSAFAASSLLMILNLVTLIVGE